MSNNHVNDERKEALNKAALLIADMTLNGATQEELERAILWSADVVQSNKEDVDWKQSYEDYVIAELEDKYQGADPSEYDKDYLVIDETFDTREEAEALVKEMNSPGLVILGPKQK